MSNLSEKSCTACQAGAPLMSDVKIKAVLVELPEWAVEVVESVNHLTRTYRFKNFVQALAFTQAVG